MLRFLRDGLLFGNFRISALTTQHVKFESRKSMWMEMETWILEAISRQVTMNLGTGDCER